MKYPFSFVFRHNAQDFADSAPTLSRKGKSGECGVSLEPDSGIEDRANAEIQGSGINTANEHDVLKSVASTSKKSSDDVSNTSAKESVSDSHKPLEDDYKKSENSKQITRTCSGCLRVFPSKTAMWTHKCRKTKCDVCLKRFSSYFVCLRHMLCHDGMVPLLCADCNFTASGEREFQEHVKTYHKNCKRPYCCTSCKISFVSLVDLASHIISNHDWNGNKNVVELLSSSNEETVVQSEPSKRLIVSLETLTKKSSKSPEVSSEGDSDTDKSEMVSYRCRFCSNIFSTKESFHAHSCRKCKCHICNKTCFSYRGLLLHTLYHPGMMMFVCKSCNYSVSNKFRFEEHVNANHKKQVKPYYCTFCKFSFSRANYLVGHLINAHSCKGTKLEDLERDSIVTEDKLTKDTHEEDNMKEGTESKGQRVSHSGTTDDEHSSQEKQAVSTKSQIEGTHTVEREHDKQETFDCEVCEMMFVDADKLVEHMMIHCGSQDNKAVSTDASSKEEMEIDLPE